MSAQNPASNKSHFVGSVSRLVMETFRSLGIQTIFGIPGIQSLELFDELAKSPINVVTTTDERAATFMADGYARTTGKIGVVVVVGGPGLTNSLTGIAEALLDSSPILVLVCVGNMYLNKRFQLHEIPHQRIAAPLVKRYYKLQTFQETQAVILQAVDMASNGENGPTVVELPSDLAMESGSCKFARRKYHSPLPLPESDLFRVIEVLQSSTSVGIYVGAGAVEAAPELLALAERLRAPVATTLSGRGVFPEDHELSAGFGFSASGTRVAYYCFERIDTLLAIACKYGEVPTGSYGIHFPKNHIHIDINPASIGANYGPTLGCVADAKRALQFLLRHLPKNMRCTDNKLADRFVDLQRKEEQKRLKTPATDGVSPDFFFRSLRDQMNREDVLVTDSGSHQFWAISNYPVYVPRTFLIPADFQAMGFSIPCAIGSKFGSPARRVVSVVGDGGFLMSGFECLTAVRQRLQICFVVFVDGEWGLIAEAQEQGYRRRVCTELYNPEYSLLAQSFGMAFEKIAHNGEVEEKLRRALLSEGPCLVQVDVRYAEPSRYVRGAIPQFRQRLPLKTTLRVAARWLSRYFIDKDKRSEVKHETN